MRRRWCFGSALALLLLGSAVGWWARSAPAVESTVDLAQLPQLAIGDWLFRLGSSADSILVHQAGGGDYSHIGMVVAIAPQVRVIHATTDDDPLRPDQVLLSSLSEFLQPSLAKRFAVARPAFLDARQKQRIAKTLLSHMGEAFILEPRDQPHLYCTTLLADAIHTQYPEFAPVWTRLDNPLFRGELLFPKAFADYPQIDWLYRH